MARRVWGWVAATAMLAAAWFIALPAHPAAAAPADDLVLKRVALSSGGVGYFEYEAPVDGDATLTLDVPLDQVDDILKSLVVYDSAGSAGEITLPGREPLTQGFIDLPFDRTALNSEVNLLNALQGAEIRVTAPKAISGRLVHVDRETVPGPGGITESHTVVSVMTDSGLKQFQLGDVDAIGFADPKLQAQVETALQRIAAYRDPGRRRLTLQLHGKGQRTVRVGYVVGMPLWKASYRLSLPADPQATDARLQGWAVLENFSGRAWDNVELTLLSGNPVTFRQALYESYYVERQSVPVESGNRVLPAPDLGSMPSEAAALKPLGMPRNTGALRAMPPGANLPFAAQMAPPGATAMGLGGMPAPLAAPPLPAAPASAPPPPPPPVAPIEAAAANEEATQVVFTVPEKVSVGAGQSLVLPLLDRELPARRVDLYQPSTDKQHPLAAVELTNSSGAGLPPGVLTLYQQSDKEGAVYLGDARLAALPAGDKRLLNYAVDGKVAIDRSSTEAQPIVKATIAGGTLHLKRAMRWTTHYRVKSVATPNPGPAPALLLEQPRQSDAKLTTPDPKTVETSGNNYRIPLTLAANGSGDLTVVEERPVEETIALLDADDNVLETLVSARDLDPKVKQALSGIAAKRQAIAEQRSKLQQLKTERAQHADDEARLRANITALASDPTLHKRMLDQFTNAETAIEQLDATIASDTAALTKAEQDLRGQILGLNL